MLITGFAMTGIVSSLNNGEQVNNIVLGLKSIVITAIFFIAYSFNKKEVTPKWVVPIIALLTTVNIAFAVLGHIIVKAA
jgi:chromate transport protein ChrA